MMTKTLRGIYHNLNDSEYSTSNNEVEYFFSSILYMDKFLCEYKKERMLFRTRMKRIVDIKNLNLDYISDFMLYRRIEKRGFKIKIIGNDETWQKSLIFAFQNVTKKSTNDYEKTQKQK